MEAIQALGFLGGFAVGLIVGGGLVVATLMFLDKF